MKAYRFLLISIMAAAVTGCATSMPEKAPATLDEELANLGYRPGEEIDRLSQYRISNWTYIDRQHFLFSSGPTHAYLISLKTPCSELSSVENLAFRTRTESLTPFDQIIVSTSATPRYCAIDNIQKLYRED